jgi:hypothetical protein
MKKVLCWFLGHRYPTVRTERSDATTNLYLLMNPRQTVECGRCGHVGEARAVIVYEGGIDYLEIRPTQE